MSSGLLLGKPIGNAMSIGQAVKSCFDQTTTLSGRSGGSAYWWFQAFACLVYLAFWAIFIPFNTVLRAMLSPNAAHVGSLVFLIIALIGWVWIAIAAFAVLVRRLHDAGHSGAWMFINLIPFVGMIVLLVFTLQDSDISNKWGPSTRGLAYFGP